MLKRVKAFFSGLMEKPAVTYCCSMSGASYCMRRHGEEGFAVAKTYVVGDLTVTKTISVVETCPGGPFSLARRFLDEVERDACACARVAA